MSIFIPNVEFKIPKTRRSPLRNINNYQFYTKYQNTVQKCDEIDTNMYLRSRSGCLNEGKVSGKNICACLYDKKGKVISSGVNSFSKSHPLQEKFGCTPYKIFLHAEIDAIVKALRKNEDLSGFRLAIARVCGDSSDAQAFPCDGCIEALGSYGCDSVTYFDESKGLSKYKF